MSLLPQERNPWFSEPNYSSPQDIIEEFTQNCLKAKNGQGINSENLLGLSKIIKAGFWEWWWALEKMGAIKTWKGFDGGKEILTQEEKDKMDRSLYDVFIFQLRREGIVLTEEEVELGYKDYEEH